MTGFDVTREPDALPDCPAAATRPPGYFWTTTEVATMRELYPKGGTKAVSAALPHRSLASIHAKAQTMGLRAPQTGCTAGLRFAKKYPQSDSIDTMIREGYAAAKKKGFGLALAKRIGRPAWWVQKRAAALGVARTVRTRLDRWKPEELAIVEDYASCEPRIIAKKLKAAGFDRTPTAVGIILKRRGIDTSDPDSWSARDLAVLLGVTDTAVRDWIERRGLPAKRRGDGPTAKWVIRRESLRRWVATHQRFIDLRKVDQVWFLELAFGSVS